MPKSIKRVARKSDGDVVPKSPDPVVVPENIDAKEFGFVEVNIDFDKRPLEDIGADAKTINPDLVAEDLLNWMESNVENFIDNSETEFQLDLVFDSADELQEVQKLQNLYRAIPDDDAKAAEEDPTLLERCGEMRTELDEIVAKVHQIARTKTELLDKLSKRMLYFYEMVGANKGEPLVKELDGSVDILELEYEAFSVGVNVARVQRDSVSGEMVGDREIVSNYTVPEGFTCLIELAYAPKKNLSMF